MNAAPLVNRALGLATPNRSSTESLEQRVSRLEAIIQQRNTQSRGMESPQPKPAAVKSVVAPKLDIAEMKREVDRRVAAMKAAEIKILNNFCGAKI